jgi:hypothetical protein
VPINPIPCIPFPLSKGKGKIISLRGAKPLLNTPIGQALLKRNLLFGSFTPQKPLLILLQCEESKREAKPLLIKYSPLPLLREGGEGDRLLIQEWRGG